MQGKVGRISYKYLFTVVVLLLAVMAVAVGCSSKQTGQQAPAKDAAPAQQAKAPEPKAEPKATPPATPIKIKIGMNSTSLPFLPFYLGTDLGIFKAEGLEVEIVNAKSNITISALSAGELDYVGSFGSTIRGTVKGLPLKVIQTTAERPMHSLVVVPSVTKADDIRGKAVALSSAGSSEYIVMRAMLESLGIKDSEVKHLQVGEPNARMAALEQGTIVATALSPPLNVLAEQRGFKLLVHAVDISEMPIAGVGTTAAKLEKQRDEVKRVLRAMVKAQLALSQQKDKSIKVFAERNKLEIPVAQRAFELSFNAFSPDGTLSTKSLQQELENAKAEGNVTEDIPLSKIADYSILYEVLKEMGITPKHKQ